LDEFRNKVPTNGVELRYSCDLLTRQSSWVVAEPEFLT
jgi:hypothetical protein